MLERYNDKGKGGNYNVFLNGVRVVINEYLFVICFLYL